MCVWWEWAGEITLPQAFGQVCLLRPSSFVFLMWCFCSPFEEKGCSCHFYWRSFIARLNGLKWQLSLPLLSLFSLPVSPTRPLTQANQRKFACLLCAHPLLSHPSPLPASKPNCREKKGFMLQLWTQQESVFLLNYSKLPLSVDLCFIFFMEYLCSSV